MSDSAAVEARRAEISAPALGMIFFISSEVMFFAALFGAYFTIRATSPGWPPAGTPHLELLLPAVGTAALVASSFTAHRATTAAEHGDRNAATRWLMTTLALGAIFLGLQATEYAQIDLEISTNVYGTLFYALTGFHGLHVFAGLVALAIVRVKLARQETERAAGTLVAASLYWHFVDAVWIVLFATLYLLD